MSHYATLGLTRDADHEAVRSAYRTLARLYHPDRGSGSSQERFREITAAYETLSNPESRRAYDLTLPGEHRVRSPEKGTYTESPAVFGRTEDLPADWILARFGRRRQQ